MKARLANLQIGEKERREKRQKTKARLDKIEAKVDAFFKGQRKELDADVIERTKSLKLHLTCTSTKDAVCRFYFIFKNMNTCTLVSRRRFLYMY